MGPFVCTQTSDLSNPLVADARKYQTGLSRPCAPLWILPRRHSPPSPLQIDGGKDRTKTVIRMLPSLPTTDTVGADQWIKILD